MAEREDTDAREPGSPGAECVADPDPEILDAYTRKEALRDGVLLDATDMAAEMGFTIPVALTPAVWARYVTLTLAARAAGQDETGRLWDILTRFRNAVLRSPTAETRSFSLQVVTASRTPDLVTLQAVQGRGDHGETVVTIMLLDED